MGIAVVADNYSVALLPLHGEAELVMKSNPEFPVLPSDFRVISEGHLDWTLDWREVLNTWPRVEPREMIGNSRVNHILIHIWRVLVRMGVVLGQHVAVITGVVNTPINLEAALFGLVLSFLWAFSSKTLLPVVVDLTSLSWSIVSFSIGQISPVADAELFKFLTEFSL